MRKEANFTVTEEGRDKGKVFVLREMSASRAERWAMRALMAAAKGGVDIPPDIAKGGMQQIAYYGIQALMGMSFEDIEPLLDEMMVCVQFMPEPATPSVVRNLIEDDIEEIATRLTLRYEVIKLHVDFSTAGSLLK